MIQVSKFVVLVDHELSNSVENLRPTLLPCDSFQEDLVYAFVLFL